MQRYFTQTISFFRLPLNALRGISIKNSSISLFWWRWVLILIVIFLVQASTISLLPHLQQDEVQITDYGRLTIDPRSDWSVTWLVGNEKPLLLWSYVGPLIAEISYQLGGYSGTGPRIASLLGGLFAATMALGWLISRRVNRDAALCLSLAFLLDPLFELSQRMARVDSWVIGFCLASCWLLHSSALKTDRINKSTIAIAGVFASIAALVWPSALFLYPLVVLELIYLIRSEVSKGNKKAWILVSSSFLTGGLLCTVLLLLPILNNLSLIFGDMKNMVALNVKSSKSILERIDEMLSSQQWVKLVKAFVKTFSPFLPLIGFIGAVFNPRKGLILTFLLALALMFATLVYEFRVLYLLPYFLAMAASIFQSSQSKPLSLAIRRIGVATLVFLMVWSIGISLFARSVIALNEKSTRDRSLLYKAATTYIGSGNYKVFLDFNYEFYYVGRSMGWKLYIPYIQFQYDSNGNWLRKNDYEPKDKFLKLLSNMDYAVFSKGSVNNEIADQLVKAGLNYQSTFEASNEPKYSENKFHESRTKQILLWFLSGKEGYGPYQLYARKRTAILTKEVSKNTMAAVDRAGLFNVYKNH